MSMVAACTHHGVEFIPILGMSPGHCPRNVFHNENFGAHSQRESPGERQEFIAWIVELSRACYELSWR